MKNVYQHPDDPHRIIKTMRPELVSPDGGFVESGPIRRRNNQGAYRQFRRELLQYLELCRRHYSKRVFRFPVETPHGLIGTSEGLGLVVEKVVAPDGTGRTLAALAAGRELTDRHLAALERFFEDCARLHIVFGEVNAAGIMYTEARSGRPEFVLVDGIGEKLFIPIRAISKTVNSRNVQKVRKRIMAGIADAG